MPPKPTGKDTSEAARRANPDDPPAVGTPKRKSRASIVPAPVSSPVRVTRRSVAAHQVEEDFQQLPLSPARSTRRRTLLPKDDGGKVEKDTKSRDSSVGNADVVGSQPSALVVRSTRRRTLLAKDKTDDSEKSLDLGKIEEESKSRSSSAKSSHSDGTAIQKTTKIEKSEVKEESKPEEVVENTGHVQIPGVVPPAESSPEDAQPADVGHAPLPEGSVTLNRADGGSDTAGAEEETPSKDEVKIKEVEKQDENVLETMQQSKESAPTPISKTETEKNASLSKNESSVVSCIPSSGMATPGIAKSESILPTKRSSLSRDESSVPTSTRSRPESPLAVLSRSSLEQRSSTNSSPAGRSRPETPVAMSPRNSLDQRSSANSTPTGQSRSNTPVAGSPRCSMDLRSSANSTPTRQSRSNTPVAMSPQSSMDLRSSANTTPTGQCRSVTPVAISPRCSMGLRSSANSTPTRKSRSVTPVTMSPRTSMDLRSSTNTTPTGRFRPITPVAKSPRTSISSLKDLPDRHVNCGRSESRVAPYTPGRKPTRSSPVLQGRRSSGDSSTGLPGISPLILNMSPKSVNNDGPFEKAESPTADNETAPLNDQLDTASSVDSKDIVESVNNGNDFVEHAKNGDQSNLDGQSLIESKNDVQSNPKEQSLGDVEKEADEVTTKHQSPIKSEPSHLEESSVTVLDKLGLSFHKPVLPSQSLEPHIPSKDLEIKSSLFSPTLLNATMSPSRGESNNSFAAISQECLASGDTIGVVTSLDSVSQGENEKCVEEPILNSPTSNRLKSIEGDKSESIKAMLPIQEISGENQNESGGDFNLFVEVDDVESEGEVVDNQRETLEHSIIEGFPGESTLSPIQEIEESDHTKPWSEGTVRGLTETAPEKESNISREAKQSPEKTSCLRTGLRSVKVPTKEAKLSLKGDPTCSSTEDSDHSLSATTSDRVENLESISRENIEPTDHLIKESAQSPTKEVSSSLTMQPVPSPTKEAKISLKEEPTFSSTEDCDHSLSKTTSDRVENLELTFCGDIKPTDHVIKESSLSPNKEATSSLTLEPVPSPTKLATSGLNMEPVPSPTKEATSSLNMKPDPSPTKETTSSLTMEPVFSPTKVATSGLNMESVPSPTKLATSSLTMEPVVSPTKVATSGLTMEPVVSPTKVATSGLNTEPVPSPTKEATSILTMEPVPSPTKETSCLTMEPVPSPTKEATSSLTMEPVPSPTKETTTNLTKETFSSLEQVKEPLLPDEIFSSPSKSNAPSPVAESIDSGNASEEEGKIPPPVQSPIVEEPSSLAETDSPLPLFSQNSGSPNAQPQSSCSTNVVKSECTGNIDNSEGSGEDGESTSGQEENEHAAVHGKDFIDDEAEESDGLSESDEEVSEDSDSTSEYSDREVLDVSCFIQDEATEKKKSIKPSDMSYDAGEHTEEPEETHVKDPVKKSGSKMRNPKTQKKPVFEEEITRSSDAPSLTKKYTSTAAAGFVVEPLPISQGTKKVHSSSTAADFARSVKKSPQKRPALDEAVEGTKSSKKRAIDVAGVPVTPHANACYLKLTKIPKGTKVQEVKQALRKFGIATGLVSIEIVHHAQTSMIADVVYDTQEHGQKALDSYGQLRVKDRLVFFLIDEDKARKDPAVVPSQTKKKSPLKKQKFVGVMSGLASDVTILDIMQAFADKGIRHITEIMIFKRKSDKDGKSCAKIKFSRRTALLSALVVSEGLEIGGELVKMAVKEAKQ